jgi:hypothetical protein
VALDALGSARTVVGIAVMLTATAAVAPLLALPALGGSAVVKSDGRLLPALVTAEARAHPGIGTLVLEPQQDGSVSAVVDHGLGTTLDETSTLWSTRRSLDASAHELAVLAGNLSSRSGFDPAQDLARFRVEFVLLPPADDASSAARQRVVDGLDATPALTPVSDTEVGRMWRVASATTAPAEAPSITNAALGILILQAVVIALALLLAIPTGRRRRVVTESAAIGEDPADTFTEDDDA